MPHQCLGCGYAFEEGSSALLQGCPECKGTRFFYTAEPIAEPERKQLQQKASKDLRQVVTELLMEQAPEAAAELEAKADADGWATLKPSDLRRIVKKVQAQQKAPAQNKGVDSPARRRAAEEAWQRIKADLEEEEAKPDTVTITGAGEYEIDVKGLLERNPIVVHKDGAYVIHLPSLFQGKE